MSRKLTQEEVLTAIGNTKKLETLLGGKNNPYLQLGIKIGRQMVLSGKIDAKQREEIMRKFLPEKRGD